MRKTIIFGALAALLGLVAVAQANDQPQSDLRGGIQITNRDTVQTRHEVAEDSRDAKHDREARNEHAREQEGETGEKRHEEREGHDADDGGEHRDRR